MVSFHTKMLHKEKKKNLLKKVFELDLCHVLSLLPGVGRGINSQIERSRTGWSKHKPRLGGRREENQDNLLGLSLIHKMNMNPKHQQSTWLMNQETEHNSLSSDVYERSWTISVVFLQCSNYKGRLCSF